MKKILFKDAYKLNMCALLLTLIIASCQKNTNDIYQKDQAAASAEQYRRTGLSTVPLKVTVAGVDGLGNPYKITSDDGTDYVNGSRTVSANFDGYGNFIFATGASSNKPGSPLVRWLNLNFDDPIQIFITPPVTAGNNRANGISTGQVAGINFTPMQSMAEGQTQCIGLTCGSTWSSSNGWTANFHRAAEDVSTSPTAYVVVTKINSTQWTMTPVGSCSPNSNVVALRNGPGTLYGYYNLPFSLTLTKL